MFMASLGDESVDSFMVEMWGMLPFQVPGVLIKFREFTKMSYEIIFLFLLQYHHIRIFKVIQLKSLCKQLHSIHNIIMLKA